MISEATSIAKDARTRGARVGIVTIGTAQCCSEPTATLATWCDASAHVDLPSVSPSAVLKLHSAASSCRAGEFLAEIAVKLVLNAVTTGGHVMKGKVLSNRMVDMQVRCRFYPDITTSCFHLDVCFFMFFIISLSDLLTTQDELLIKLQTSRTSPQTSSDALYTNTRVCKHSITHARIASLHCMLTSCPLRLPPHFARGVLQPGEQQQAFLPHCGYCSSLWERRYDGSFCSSGCAPSAARCGRSHVGDRWKRRL
jgi:hypothetical protein